MASFEIHWKKYRLFLRDALNEQNSEPTRIEAFFEAAFHLIESVAAKNRVHINKHQLVRDTLEQNRELFQDDTERVWRAFQEIENQIRPGQIYGGSIDGEELKRTQKLFKTIERICKAKLGGIRTRR